MLSLKLRVFKSIESSLAQTTTKSLTKALKVQVLLKWVVVKLQAQKNFFLLSWHIKSTKECKKKVKGKV